MKSKRIVFLSWHFYLDHSNGASLSTRQLLLGLGRRGWDVETFCGPSVDNYQVADVRSVLKDYGIRASEATWLRKPVSYSIFSFSDSGIRSRVYTPDRDVMQPTRESGVPYLEAASRLVDKSPPDVVVTYGGGPVALELHKLARRARAKTIFLLHNFSYWRKATFENVDLTVVPTEFAQRLYRQRLGLETVVVAPVMKDAEIAYSASEDVEGDRKHVLFINPSPEKGVYFVARILRDAWVRRPDISFLIVEGRASGQRLFETGIDLTGVNNFRVVQNVPNVAELYRQAKITLMPSVWTENFGCVAAESMIAGVPVIASDRGGLPSTVGDSATVLHIDERYTPDSTTPPTSEEAAPWLDEIVRLWDDQQYYAQRREQGLLRSKQWRTDAILDRYEELIGGLLAARDA